MERKILIAALVLGILVDVFFAIVNFYPVAPPRSRGPRREIIAEMDRRHARWFQENVLDEFNHEHNVNLVIRATPGDEILERLRSSRDGRHGVWLAILPSAYTRRAVHERLVRPVDEIPDARSIAADFGELRPEVMAAARVDGRQYFLPRMTLLDLAVYRSSKVRDAVLHWLPLRPAIESALRAMNGRGLPEGYELERSPTEWDTYDAFVIGYFWAHRSYADLPPRPRMAHRSDPGVPGEAYLLSTIYRAGATDATIRQVDSPSAVDALAWDALFRREGLYPEAMSSQGGMDAESIVGGIAEGRLFLAPVDETEAFRIHGGAMRDAESQVDDPDDLGFAAMPHGASLELDATGRPARVARGFSFREDSVWALPAGGPDDALAYEFLRFAWSREMHVRECEAIGILPLRNDVVLARASIFRLGWQQEIFEGALAQWDRAEALQPSLLDDGVGTAYQLHWRTLVAQRPVTSLAAVAMALRTAPVATVLPASVPPGRDAPRDDLELWRSTVQIQLPDASAPGIAADDVNATDASAGREGR
ncbi:MAG: hypothetical protein WCJ30_04655 [Deltaproteobacteria bacterium]